MGDAASILAAVCHPFKAAIRHEALIEEGVSVESILDLREQLAKERKSHDATKAELVDAKVELRAAKARLLAAGIKTKGGLYRELVKASKRFEKNNGTKPAS